MSDFNQPSVGQLKKALQIAEKIEALEAELATILGSKSGRTRSLADSEDGLQEYTGAKRGPKPKKKRQLSDEARQRIADAQRARWAKVRGEDVSNDTSDA